MRPHNHILEPLVATPEGTDAWFAIVPATQETAQLCHAPHKGAHRQSLPIPTQEATDQPNFRRCARLLGRASGWTCKAQRN